MEHLLDENGDIMLPWDFHFMKSLGKAELYEVPAQKRLEEKSKRLKIPTSMFYTDIFVGEKEDYFVSRMLHRPYSKSYSSVKPETIRLGFFILKDNMYLLTFTKFVEKYLISNGIITEKGVFPLLGFSVAYQIAEKNGISKSLLCYTYQMGATTIDNETKEVKQIKEVSCLGYYFLNRGENEDGNQEVILKKDCMVKMKKEK